jgi:hypothetical protein
VSNRIKELKQRLSQVGSMLPGSLREQWYTCKTKNCRCRDEQHPIKHGPYHQLSFTVGGKSSTLIIKEDDINTVREQIEHYKTFKKLSQELIKEYLEVTRKDGVKDWNK